MNALSLSNVSKTYSNGLLALHNINLNIAEGDFFALLGRNGAGKSTTIGIICSLILKTHGKISIFNHDLDKETAQAKSLIGVVPQEINLNLFETLIQILINQAGYYGVPKHEALRRAEYYLKEMSLWDMRHDKAFQLSGGMKRRLLLARALMNEPKLLILDEPTAGVDIELRHTIWNFLKKINQKGTTIILTTHYLEEAENLCKNVAIIDGGEIIENAPVKTLINRLNTQTYILESLQPLPSDLGVINYIYKKLDETSFEIMLPAEQSLNQLIHDLDKLNIAVKSIRLKTNRLEELFINLVRKNH